MDNERSPSYKEERPWGAFERFTLNEPSTVKIITVNAGEAFSLQRHAHRDEWWKMLSGEGTVVVGDTHEPVAPGKEFFVPRGAAHRVIAGDRPVTFLEIALGNFDEDDIVRLEDRYHRT